MRTLTYRDRIPSPGLPEGALLAWLGVLAIVLSLAWMLVMSWWTGAAPGWPPCDDQPGSCPALTDAAAAAP